MKNILTILLLLACSSVFFAQTIEGTLEHDGIDRDYILHLPTGYDAAQEYPLVFNLHGYTSNAQQQQFYSGMDVTADNNGFIVCYPNGVDNAWNVGWSFGSEADDVGFLTSLIDVLSEDYSINQNRVYSCGMSNGGFMSYVLACEANDRFAAIASVTGAMVPGQFADCTPEKAVPVMQIHGTADPTVAYNGTPFVSEAVEEVIDFWTNNNNCIAGPDTIEVEDIVSTDFCTAQRIEYTEGENGSEVVFYKIQNGAHTWPDATVVIGVTNQDFNASQEIWNFFNRFDLNGAIVSDLVNVSQVVDIQVVPNPVFNEFFIEEMPADTEKISVFDIYGNLIKQVIVNQGQASAVDVSDLARGLYFVATEGENSRGLAKFIVL